jgi:hypothetical protein
MLDSRVGNIQKNKWICPVGEMPTVYQWTRMYFIEGHGNGHQCIHKPLLYYQIYTCLNLKYQIDFLNHGPYCEEFSITTIEQNIPFAIIFSVIL